MTDGPPPMTSPELAAEMALSMECDLTHYRLDDGAMVESRVVNSANTFIKSADVRQALIAALTRAPSTVGAHKLVPLIPTAEPPPMTSPELRTKIAQIICCGPGKCILEDTDRGCLACDEEHGETDLADAILALTRAPSTVGAHKLVPLIPTAEMIEVGCENNPTQWNDGTPDGFAADVANDIYVSMVRAAPTLASEKEGGKSALPFVVEYRRRDFGHLWIPMAAFDTERPAEAYLKQQRTDDRWPWVYRAVNADGQVIANQENLHGSQPETNEGKHRP